MERDRREATDREVGVQQQPEVGAVHVGVPLLDPVPVPPGLAHPRLDVLGGGAHGAHDHLRAHLGQQELGGQPVRRHHGVGVGAGQPDPRGVGRATVAGHVLGAGAPGGADGPGVDVQDVGAGATLRELRRPVAAAVGDHGGPDDEPGPVRHGDRGGPLEGGQAARQQGFLVVGRHHDVHGLDAVPSGEDAHASAAGQCSGGQRTTISTSGSW